MQKENQENQRARVTILHYQGIGDNVLGLPLVRALREAKPELEIRVMVPRSRFCLYRGSGADDCFTYKQRQDHLTHPKATILDLDTGTDDPRYHRMIADLRCRRLLGFRDTGSPAPRSGRVERFALDQRPMWRQYLDFVPRLTNEPPSFRLPALHPSAEAERFADEHLAGKRNPVCIAPGAGVPDKRWPAPRFAALARHVKRRWGVPVAWLGSASERDLVDEDLDPDDPDTLDLFGCSLDEAAGVLARSRLTLANDSAMLHMAAALDRPTVGIYGRYCSPQTSRPMGRRYSVVYARHRHPKTVPVEEVRMQMDRALDPRFEEPWTRRSRVVMVGAAEA